MWYAGNWFVLATKFGLLSATRGSQWIRLAALQIPEIIWLSLFPRQLARRVWHYKVDNIQYCTLQCLWNVTGSQYTENVTITVQHDTWWAVFSKGEQLLEWVSRGLHDLDRHSCKDIWTQYVNSVGNTFYSCIVEDLDYRSRNAHLDMNSKREQHLEWAAHRVRELDCHFHIVPYSWGHDVCYFLQK